MSPPYRYHVLMQRLVRISWRHTGQASMYLGIRWALWYHRQRIDAAIKSIN